MSLRQFAVNSTFPLAHYSAGDLIFFHRLLGSAPAGNFENAVLSSSILDSNVFHVAIIVDELHSNKSEENDNCKKEFNIVHATPKHGVILQSLDEALLDLEPDVIELCLLDLPTKWKNDASLYAINAIGAKYNDLFAPNLINSHGHLSYYCCQLVSESYKSTNVVDPSKSPFLSHSLNFKDAEGKLIPYWIDYYKRLGKLEPPQDQPGSHPSILRASPCTKLTASRYVSKLSLLRDNAMKKFVIPKDLLKALHFINGARVDLQSATKIEVFEPRNGNLLTVLHAASAADVQKALSAAQTAQRDWAATSWAERRRVLQHVADIIRKEFNEIASWEVRDNGKSITEAKIDILSCADTFEYYSGADLAGDHLPYADSQQRFAYTRREPLGVVGGIGAWNYPFQTATWKIAPAIACGNAVVYKPSPLAPVSPVILSHLLKCAGLPDGIVNIVQGGAETGSALCKSDIVKKISFTGSMQTGKAIAAASATTSLKPVTLELGGKSACIIFPDVDLEMAVHGALMANFLTQGQVCTNASKIIVHRSILDEFTTNLLLKTENLRIGDPMNELTHIGAYISKEHKAKVKAYIDGAVKEGAKLLYGGKDVNVEAMEGGYYMSPCVLSEITPQMTVYKEEIFGAVLLLIPFETEEEALKIANDTEAGLAAGVFTSDLSRAYTFASRLETGTVYVNTYNDISQYVPFGGYNQSGYGRENGKAAIDYYTQLKSVFINASGKLDNPFA